MFICEVTKKCSRPGEKMHRVVVSRREVSYSNRIRGGEGETKQSTGFEIVKEVGVSTEGLAMIEAAKLAGTPLESLFSIPNASLTSTIKDVRRKLVRQVAASDNENA